MKTYTEKEVEKIVKDAIESSVQGLREWIKKETDIVDKETKSILENAIIDLKPNSNGLMKEYIYPKLAKKGIIFQIEN